MTKYYICIGDRTTGGGVVLEGNPTFTIMGRPSTTVGMKAICCSRPQVILQGWATHTAYGRMMAYDGCILSCGHKVVSSQNLMGWDAATDTSIPEHLIKTPQKYHEFFILKDDDDLPVANQKYKMTAGDGTELIGFTDANGKTEYLWTDEKSPIILEVMEDEEDPNTDNYHLTDV